MADLSGLSTEDLLALKGGDLSKVSTAGLVALKGLQPPARSAAERVANDSITKGAQEVIGTTPAELIAGSAPGRFAQGAAAPFLGLAQLAAHVAGGGETMDEVIKRAEEQKRAGMKAYDTEGVDVAGLAGNVLSPLPLKVAGMLPKAATLPGKMATGAATGAVYGGTTPVEKPEEGFAKEKAIQTGAGATLGAALPPAGSLVRGLGRTIYSAVEPIVPGGPEAILGRFHEKVLGPAKDKVVAALESARQLVPGSAPTAGEAVADLPGAVNLAAHQRLVAKSEAAAPGFVQRGAEQEGARMGALGEVAGTPEALKAAEGARAAEAGKNYEAAFAEVTKRDKELAGIMKDPYVKKALPDARDLAKSKGITAKDDLTQFLHYVKVGLDKQLDRTGEGALANTEKEAVRGVKEKLLSWMDEKNPAYAEARTAFAAASRPISQMRVGQALQDRLQAPLGASERAASYASSLRDPAALIRETGSVKPLEEVLTPDQLGKVQSVGADLTRKAMYDRLSRGSNVSSPDEAHSLLPNLLSRPAMAANWIARNVFRHDLESNVNKVAGEQYLDPAKLAAALKDKPISERQKIVEELMSRYAQPAVVGAPTVGFAKQF